MTDWITDCDKLLKMFSVFPVQSTVSFSSLSSLLQHNNKSRWCKYTQLLDKFTPLKTIYIVILQIYLFDLLQKRFEKSIVSHFHFTTTQFNQHYLIWNRNSILLSANVFTATSGNPVLLSNVNCESSLPLGLTVVNPGQDVHALSIVNPPPQGFSQTLNSLMVWYVVTRLSNCQSISTAAHSGQSMQASLPIKSRHRWGIFINCGHVRHKIFDECTCTVVMRSMFSGVYAHIWEMVAILAAVSSLTSNFLLLISQWFHKIKIWY